jgi:shikimate kinase
VAIDSDEPVAVPLVLSLVGLPGCGKTTVGRQLARKLHMRFVDSDHAIEERLGCTVREFFEREGESRFRDIEEQVIDNLTQRCGTIVSTGGGAVLREVSRLRLRERSQVIYLKSTPDELYRRLRHDTMRPLLQVADPLARLRALFEERDPLYREIAHFVLETGRPQVPSLVNMLVMQLELAGLYPQPAA